MTYAGNQGQAAAQTLLDAAAADWDALSLPGSMVTDNLLQDGKPLGTLYSLKRSAQRGVVLRASLPAALAAAPAQASPALTAAHLKVCGQLCKRSGRLSYEGCPSAEGSGVCYWRAHCNRPAALRMRACS